MRDQGTSLAARSRRAFRAVRRAPRGARNAARRLAEIEASAQRIEAWTDQQAGPALDARLAVIEGRLGNIEAHLAALTEPLARVEVASQAAAETATRFEGDWRVWREREHEILEVIHDNERINRERVGRQRGTPDYEEAYTEEEPLVSVLIGTDSRYQLLRDRALPSVLAQSYRNIEVVVVGDDAPPETAEVIEQLGESRVRYHNLGPHLIGPEDRQDKWMVAGTVAMNAAIWLARGRWIAPFADDDALRPDAVESMLEFVRSNRLEFGYGQVRAEFPDGRVDEKSNRFPPELYHAGLQGSLYHAHLRFIDLDLTGYLFDHPNDWSQTRRMLRAGVRLGFLDQIVADYYPSMRGEPEQ